MKYRYKTKPYKHQVKALKKLLSNGFGGGLLMEPRTGKTKTAIDYLSIMATLGRCDRAVIICPTRVMDVWIEEFHLHCPLPYHITVWDKHERKRAKLMPPRGPYKLHLLLVNYEAFGVSGKKLKSGRRSKASGRFAYRAQVAKWINGKPAACILDESHRIKSPSGRAATMIVSMGSFFAYRLILTGTPITKAKRAFDIWMQWQFLNPERFEDIANSTEFKDRYGVWTKRNGFPQFLRSRNTEELLERIHTDAYSITRAECYDLPERTDRIIHVKLQESARVYDELAEEMVAEIEAEEDRTALAEASIGLVLTLRLSQITGGFVTTTDKEIVGVGTEKLEVLEELLDEHIENDEKVVIAARFRADLDAIQAMCQRKGIPTYQVRGKMRRSETTESIIGFREASGVAACLINPQAGGLGIDLSTASHMIWYSLTPSWVNFTQACDRIALSKNATTFTFLLAEDTVDTLLYDTLQKDGDIGRAVLDHPRKVLRK